MHHHCPNTKPNTQRGQIRKLPSDLLITAPSRHLIHIIVSKTLIPVPDLKRICKSHRCLMLHESHFCTYIASRHFGSPGFFGPSPIYFLSTLRQGRMYIHSYVLSQHKHKYTILLPAILGLRVSLDPVLFTSCPP